MKLLKLLCLLSLVFAFQVAEAQDIHFSQFNLSPLSLNPANAGAFKGTVRLGGIYRDQWASVIDNQFTTPSFYLDAPVYRGFGKKDWIGVGVSFLSDRSGTANLRNTTISGAVSYHLALDAQRKNILTIAGQVGQVQKRFDQTALLFENQYVGGGVFNPSAPTGEGTLQDNISYLDFAAGLSFRSRPSANFSWNIGASAFHLTEPAEGFLNSTNVPRRIVANIGATFDLSEKWRLNPLVLYQMQSGASELIAQAIFGHRMGEAGDFILNMGAGYRLNDAAMVILGMEYNKLIVGLSYDINVSTLGTTSNYQGGFEVGLGYIISIPKTPNIPPVIFNPRF